MGNHKNHIPLGNSQKRPQYDPRRPLPGEVPPGRLKLFVLIGGGIGLFVLGALFGIFLSPEPNSALTDKLTETNSALQMARTRLIELERALSYKSSTNSGSQPLLNPKQKKTIEAYEKESAV